jgi:hypothetical protein
VADTFPADPDTADLITRLDVVEARLAALSRMPYPPGLGDPDPGAEERWDAARVWAHMFEFVGYWTGQAGQIVAAESAGEPPPFGRLKDDPVRVGAVERDRLMAREKLWAGVHDGIEEARAFFSRLTPGQLDRVAAHPVRGPKTVHFIFEEFIVKHLEEHADQLDRLAALANVESPPAS